MNDDLKRDEKERCNAVENIAGAREANEGLPRLSRRTFFMSVAGALGTFFFAAERKRTLADSKPLYVPGASYALPVVDQDRGVYRPIGLVVRQTSFIYSPVTPPDNSVRRGEQAVITMTLNGSWDPTDQVTLTTDTPLVDVTIPGSPGYGTATSQLTVKRLPKNVNGRAVGITCVQIPLESPQFVTLVALVDGEPATPLTFTLVANA